MAVDGLTKLDREFIEEYFSNNFNATAAYRKVFKTKSEYAKRSAWNLMNKPVVKMEIERIYEEVREANKVKRENIMTALNDLMIESIATKNNNILLKTIDIINKMNGNYTTQIDATITGNINLTIPGLEIPDTEEEDKDEDE